jgi:hypothetical protein
LPLNSKTSCPVATTFDILIEVPGRDEVEYLIVRGSPVLPMRLTADQSRCVARRERANRDRLAGAVRELHGPE